MLPATIVLRPSGRYCAELKPILALYWYQPVTGIKIVGSLEGRPVEGMNVGVLVGATVGLEVGQ